MQDEFRGEQEPARAGLVGRSWGFILSAGCDTVLHMFRYLWLLLCEARAVGTHRWKQGYGPWHSAQQVLIEHLLHTRHRLSRQPWPLPPWSSSLSREMDMTNDRHNQEQQGRSGVLLQA